MCDKTVRQAILLRDITPTQQLVLIHLAYFRHYLTGLCCPSVKTLAESSGLSEITVKRALAYLEKKLFISRQKRFRTINHQLSSSYILHFASKDFVNHVSMALAKQKKVVTKATEKAYEESFFSRYGVNSALVDGLTSEHEKLVAFVKDIGSDIRASWLAKHYLTMSQFEKDDHSVGCLKTNANKVIKSSRLAQSKKIIPLKPVDK